MTRRELARRSGVSQRYIALIEAGKGNVSIVLLLQILNAFRSDATKGSLTGKGLLLRWANSYLPPRSAICRL